ncbi:hypothetical protein ZEAMMB73_Zm00001d033867 [Zea mays]|uniref:Uncharacterized protein n=1 Tax=Zea mays TaxID=4577 RepID=A0A1D6L301_MAIZE|nr:hypothetical protein ZEAMMB73_Zm00001d033867 [Zea mays]ONM08836.1 hypothetical protein ZEAMMB73_Zm00001d033867 [Zea mays]
MQRDCYEFRVFCKTTFHVSLKQVHSLLVCGLLIMCMEECSLLTGQE